MKQPPYNWVVYSPTYPKQPVLFIDHLLIMFKLHMDVSENSDTLWGIAIFGNIHISKRPGWHPQNQIEP